MMYRLIILNGERRGERITVSADPMRIGRDKACEICFADPEVASQHAEIAHCEVDLFIKDLGSMNRILVNNRETREAKLKHGDVVEVGHTRFLVQAYVQAEVQGEALESKRRLWKTVSVAVTILIIAIIGIQRCHRQPTPAATPPHRVKKQAGGPTAKTALVPLSQPSPRTNVAPPQAAVTSLPAVVQPPTNTTALAPDRPPSDTNLSSAIPPPTPVVTQRPPEIVAAETLIRTTRTDTAAAEVALARKELDAAAKALLQSRVQELMAGAQAAMSNKSTEEADQVLAGIQNVAPELAEPYAERARLLASRGWLQPAIDQWQYALRRTPADSPLAILARDELKRLQEAREHFVFPFAGRIKIIAPELTKFPENAAQKELRVLAFALEAAGQDKEIPSNTVKVEVLFYDRDPATGLIHPTDAVITPAVIPQTPWLAGARKQLTASYSVPAGATHVAPFYGYLIRVHYYGALQDEWMQPKDLPADVQMAQPEPQPATPPGAQPAKGP